MAAPDNAYRSSIAATTNPAAMKSHLLLVIATRLACLTAEVGVPGTMGTATAAATLAVQLPALTSAMSARNLAVNPMKTVGGRVRVS